MQTLSYSPEQVIPKEPFHYSISSVEPESETESLVSATDTNSSPSHPNYERLINRSFYGFWQV